MADWGKLKEKLKRGKFLEIAVVLLLVVIVLAVFFTSFGGGPAGEDAAASDFVAETESRLKGILSKVEGVGDVDVFLTVASDGETVIATETTVSADGTVTTTPILVGGEVVVLEKKNPEITGVLVVAEGAENLGVRFRLLEATASVLDIDQSLIKVYAKDGANR